MHNISYGGGLRATAATTTADFRPLDAGLINEVDKSLVADHNKVERVYKLIEIRGGDDDTLGALSERQRKTPSINPSA